jgi:hypothetical protein
MRLYSLACSLLNNLCVIDTKDIDACGCIGSAFNEILPRSPHWLHGESMVADFQQFPKRAPGNWKKRKPSVIHKLAKI